MFNFDKQILELIRRSLSETGYMVLVSLIAAVLIGGLLGLLLYLTSERLFVKNKVVNSILGVILNVVRSIPFLILMIFLLPLTALIVGTKIGTTAVIVPLSIASIAFLQDLQKHHFQKLIEEL